MTDKSKLTAWRDDIGYLKLIITPIAPENFMRKKEILETLNEIADYLELQKAEMIQQETKQIIREAEKITGGLDG
jgi:division protein CdvB (Snf7/Vps24/ESCRT-III family)